MNNILKLKITTKKSALESVRQIIRQKMTDISAGIRTRPTDLALNVRVFSSL
jgi:hypothetical protein